MRPEVPMERELELTCGGKRVPMNHFAREIVLNVVLGLVRALKGADTEAEITLRVGPARKP
jgi:hypothetical protein